nr:integrase/recombinase xerD homolog [Crassostrea gigas]
MNTSQEKLRTTRMTRRKFEVRKTAPSDNKNKGRTGVFTQLAPTRLPQRRRQARQPSLVLLCLLLLRFSHSHTSNSPFVANLHGVNHSPVTCASTVFPQDTGKPTVPKTSHKVNDKYKVPDRRIEDAVCCLKKVIGRFPDITARELAQVVGKIISMTPVMDIFKVGRWMGINNESKDRRLEELASELPRYCITSKADNTAKQYRYAFNTFCKWCNSFNPLITPLPASETNVALYIIHLAKQYKSLGKIHSAAHAISWAHSLAGYVDPCDSILVKNIKEGAIRETSKPVTKKEPITPEHLKALVSTFGKNDNLYNLRTLCMCFLGFAGFLRFSEIVNIRYLDICLQNNCVEINIVKSKTDVYKTGQKVCIARTFWDTCPVNILEKFLRLSNADRHSSQYLFRSVSFCKKSNSYRLRTDNRPISYTRAREIILDALEKIGLEKSKFGVHSLRSGGATSAAAAGVCDRLFKKHGRWRSDRAKDGYVKENLSEKLKVTKNLGI